MQESGCRVDLDCGVADDGKAALPAHLGFHQDNVELGFGKAGRIEPHLAAVHKLFRDTDPKSPIHIFFLSRMGMVRSVAAAFIMQLAFKDLSGKQQGM